MARNKIEDLINMDYSVWEYKNGEFVYEPNVADNSDAWFIKFT